MPPMPLTPRDDLVAAGAARPAGLARRHPRGLGGDAVRTRREACRLRHLGGGRARASESATAARARRWTYGADDARPRWSPDGTRIAFLSDRAERGTHGLYVLDVDGGEARPLVTRKRSVGAFAWAPDGRSIAFLAPAEPTADDERREEERDDADVYGERWPTRARLDRRGRRGPDHRAGPALGARGGRHVTELAWLARRCAAGAARPGRPAGAAHDVHGGLGGLRDGRARRECPSTDDARPVLERRHRRAGRLARPRRAEQRHAVGLVAHRGGGLRLVGTGRDEPRCTAGLAPVAGGDRVVAVVAEGLDTRLEWVDPATGEREVAHDLGGECGGLSAAGVPGGTVLARAAPRGRRRGAVAGRTRRRPAPGARPRRRHRAGRGAGRRRPQHPGAPGRDRCRRDPAGRGRAGPTGAEAGEVRGPPSCWCTAAPTRARAWSPTPTRSTGASCSRPRATRSCCPTTAAAWATATTSRPQARGTWAASSGTTCWPSVDAAVEAGIADPDRLGIGGWSQGGFLTAWAVTATDRFRVGVMGAGVSDWGMMAATSDLPDFEAALGGSRPWDGLGPHHAAARLADLVRGTAHTPLLILHGAEDERVPLSQAVAFHRALARPGRAGRAGLLPARAPRASGERRHQVDVQERVVRWFDRHLR